MINLYEVLKNFPNLSRQLNCKGMLFTQYDCPQSSKKEQFFIESHHIVYVISGRRIFHKGNRSWDLHEGTCVFVKKGTHVAEKPEGEGWCVMVFFMPDGFLKQLIQENRPGLLMNNKSEISAEHIIPLDVNDLSRSFFYSMLPYFTQSPPPHDQLLELKFKELVLSLLFNRLNQQLLNYLNSLSNDEQPSMEQVMQNNYAINLSLSDYAKLTCKSIPTFKREFKRLFHDSPAKWVARKKIDLARELLETTRLSVGEITFECGFENQTHFSRKFKEQTGQSPLQFRMTMDTASKSD